MILGTILLIVLVISALAVVFSILFCDYLDEWGNEFSYYKLRVRDGFTLRTFIVKALGPHHLERKLTKMHRKKVADFSHYSKFTCFKIDSFHLEEELNTYYRNGGYLW